MSGSDCGTNGLFCSTQSATPEGRVGTMCRPCVITAVFTVKLPWIQISKSHINMFEGLGDSNPFTIMLGKINRVALPKFTWASHNLLGSEWTLHTTTNTIGTRRHFIVKHSLVKLIHAVQWRDLIMEIPRRMISDPQRSRKWHTHTQAQKGKCHLIFNM